MPIDEVTEKLQALFVAYSKDLPNKIQFIETVWNNLETHWDRKQFQDFHRFVHTLCGSAGTYGYTALGKSARQLEIYLQSLLTASALSLEEQHHITHLFNQLKETFRQGVTEAFPYSGNGSTWQQIKSKVNQMVYIFDHDEEFIREIGNEIKHAGYDIRKIADITELTYAIQEKIPNAIIVDIECVDDEDICFLHGIQKQFTIPLFCTATKSDILTRLTAIRMGNQAFLQKPLDSFHLTKILDQYCGFVSVEPYRILIIEDSHSLAEYFALTLQEAGMITHFITNPLLLIEAIEEFQPDLLLMDVYMPECTGLELAGILRQEIQYTKIPIIFLSIEDDRLKQLSALNLGGDDFLTKPILPQHLVKAVQSRAKRAGILNAFMMRDSLTGLLNHTHLLQRLDIELARAARQSEPLSFVMIDIDHFKKINDTYGHPMGDKIIKSLSSLLLSSLRKTDVVGRYGGEEFSIILPNTTKEASLRICNYLLEKFFAIGHILQDHEFHVTFSAGVSSFPEIQDAKSIINCADQMLYVAKQNGRNRVMCHDVSQKITL